MCIRDRNLAIRNNSSTNEPKVAYIEFEGEGVVTAADIPVSYTHLLVAPKDLNLYYVYFITYPYSMHP